MRAHPRSSALLAVCAILLIGPWVYFMVQGWHVAADCSGNERAPASFGYLTAFAAFWSLVVAAIAAFLEEEKHVRHWCILACVVSLAAILIGVLVGMSIAGSGVDCGPIPLHSE